MKNAAQCLFDIAKATPERPAIISAAASVDYQTLAELSARLAYRMAAHGVRPGSCIALNTKDTVVALATVFASALVKCSWVFDTPALRRSEVVRPTHWFAFDVPDQVHHAETTRIDGSWFEAVDPSLRARIQFDPRWPVGTDWLIFPSSGTTGTPKFMSLDEPRFQKRCIATADSFGIDTIRAVFLFSLHSPPTLFRALNILINGGALVESADPAFWIEQEVTDVLGSPLQIRELIDDFPENRTIKRAWIGGASLPDPLARRLLAVFDVLFNTYGAAEANMVLENQIQIRDGSLERRTRWRDSVVEITDPDGRPLPIGEEGIVRVKNDYLVTGYLGNPAANREAFRDGWFYPGDLGRIDQSNTFHVTGRVNDTFNLGGRKLNAMVLDHVLLGTEGVREATAFLVADEDGIDEVVAFLVVENGVLEYDAKRAAQISVAGSLGPDAVPSKFLFVDAIPRTPSGKPDRQACHDMAISGRNAKA